MNPYAMILRVISTVYAMRKKSSRDWMVGCCCVRVGSEMMRMMVLERIMSRTMCSKAGLRITSYDP